jgi:4-hydroxy-tetrahydrodipicolinate synthase
MAAMCRAALAGDRAEATALNARLEPLHRALFVESNPIPVKWALHELGLCGDGIRLPLTWLAPEHQPPVREALAAAGLL